VTQFKVLYLKGLKKMTKNFIQEVPVCHPWNMPYLYKYHR
jgi:hypothetical protein